MRRSAQGSSCGRPASIVSSWRTVTGGASGPASASAREIRDHVAERRVDVEPALVAQREHRHRHEALRHRADAEGRVGIGRGARLEVADAAPAGVDELAVERDAVGDARRAELAEGLREEGVDGGREVAHARGAPGVGEVGVHVRGILDTAAERRSAVPSSGTRSGGGCIPAPNALASGAMPGLRINHVSVSSPDQDESARFYTELFGAERIPAPNFGFRVDWFRFGDTQLHIFPEDDKAPKRHHLGITVDDILPVYRRAKELGVIDPVFTDYVRVLEDGNVQFYLRDPGGQPGRDQRAGRRLHDRRHPRAQAADGALSPGARERRRPALP